MALHIAKLLSLGRIRGSWYRHSRSLTTYTSKGHVQEFPNQKLDNRKTRDYVLLLPEPLNELPSSNELVRLPSPNEPEIDYSKLTPELVYKAASQAILNFENYVADVNNNDSHPDMSLKEFFLEIERHQYPMDTSCCTLNALMNVDWPRFGYEEMVPVIERMRTAMDNRLMHRFREQFLGHVYGNYSKLSPIDKKMIRIYFKHSPTRERLPNADEAMSHSFDMRIRQYEGDVRTALANANVFFSFVVDDPDILSAVSPAFDNCQDLHHKERTPLRVTIDSYRDFMRLCPDRFVRQNCWQTKNKRCSPKAAPSLNASKTIDATLLLRRKSAFISGYRTHFERRLSHAMASSKQQVIDTLQHLKLENQLPMQDRLLELNDYAADNYFEDPSQRGIQEYDLDFWTHKYNYEILIGKSESEVRSYFPLDVVMKGVQGYFKKYLGVDIIHDQSHDNRFWSERTQLLSLKRRDQSIGNLIFDPFKRRSKAGSTPSHFRLRSRSSLFDCLPLRLISSHFKQNPETKQAYLSPEDIRILIYQFAQAIQSFTYNYGYLELNYSSAIEVDAQDLFPNLCAAQFLTDHRILQSCSDRGGSKPIDTDLTSKILKTFLHLKPLRVWHDLYEAHFDVEVHSMERSTKKVAREIYNIYSPFMRDPDNYDYCAMDIFTGRGDGLRYTRLWSRQLAHFCHAGILAQNNQTELAMIEVDKIREFNEKLLDSLCDPNKFDTKEKLLSLVGRSFEPTQTGLGVL